MIVINITSNRIMKKSEHAEASEYQDGVDMISNLPNHVLQLILSCIPSTEEVIRTSILSRRWRYLWTAVPSIDIDYTRGRDPLKEFECNKFKEFVYWVLAKKSVDLDSFRLWCASYYSMSTIGRWVHAAVMRKVKVVDLMFCPMEEIEVPVEIEVPHGLVTCGSLEVLKLCLLGCRLRLPIFPGFPALRVLELNNVGLFEDNTVKYFLESCPLLEDLSLIECFAYSLVISSPKLKSLRIDTQQSFSDEEAEDAGLDWTMCYSLEICCPKLEILKLTGYVALNIFIESLCSLKKAVIHPIDLFALDRRAPPYDLFARISHVESLSISLYCVGQSFDPEVDAPISLPYLKTLELTVDGSNIHALIPFLRCFPDVESLHLIILKWNLQDPATISILTRHLKKVEFLDFDEEKEKLVVARALLEYGNELEEMVFSWGDKASFHERSEETMNQVSKFHKASSTVKLTAVLDPSQAKPILQNEGDRYGNPVIDKAKPEIIQVYSRKGKKGILGNPV